MLLRGWRIGLVGKWVSAAAVSFAPACEYFRNAKVTGIPVRKEFFALRPRAAGGDRHLLVFGGSQGALVFNTMMPRIAAALLASCPGIDGLAPGGRASCGGDAGSLPRNRARMHRGGKSPPFSMICRGGSRPPIWCLARSGASTVAELCAAAQKPALLVPFPQATDDHQRKNAEVMAWLAARRGC